jgi:long-chain fatty acid transport protein
MNKTPIAIAAGLLLSAIPLSSQATNGYSQHGFGTKSKSMAGAGVALPLEGLSAATNPALMVDVGKRMDLGLALFSPSRSYTADDNGSPVGPPMGPPTIVPGTYESENDYFLIPHFAYNTLIDENSSIGVAIAGNGGLNTEYPNAVFAPFNNPMMGTEASAPTGVDLMQLFIGVPYAIRLNSQHSLGIMPFLAGQRFKAYGLEPFTPFSLHPDSVTNEGYDYVYGGGARIGWYGKFTDQFSAGASYQTRTWMSSFDKYDGLFAEEGDMDVPSTFTIGLAFKATPAVTLVFDIQHIFYSEVAAIGNQNDKPFFGMTENGQMYPLTLLGTDDGIGFGWEDMTIGKLGVQWEYQPGLIFRAGYSKGNQIIDGSQALLNILAPGVITDHWTFGMTQKYSSGHEFNLSFMYAPEVDVHGSNPNTGPQTGEIGMEQWEIEASWGMTF